VLLSVILLLCCFKIVCHVCGRKHKLSPSPSADVHELIAIVSNGTDSKPATSTGEVGGEFSDTHFGISGYII
jgi:hypothetical protein